MKKKKQAGSVSLDLKRFEIAALVTLILLLVSPLFASADTANVEAKIQSLLAQVQALQAQLQQLIQQPTLPATPTQPDDYGTGATPPGVFCPKLSITMQRGSRDLSAGGQVTELQIFLADYYDLNEEDIVTGYFGKLTQATVIRFQQEHGLPAFGIAGSLTRAKIAEVCGGGTGTNSITVSVDSRTVSSLAPQDVNHLDFTPLILTNNGESSVVVRYITVSRTGTATGVVLTDVRIGTSEGDYSVKKADFDSSNNVKIPTNITISSGETKELMVMGDTAADLSASAGQTIGLSIVGIGADVPVRGVMPIYGALHTVDTTLVCASQYVYKCNTSTQNTLAVLVMSKSIYASGEKPEVMWSTNVPTASDWIAVAPPGGGLKDLNYVTWISTSGAWRGTKELSQVPAGIWDVVYYSLQGAGYVETGRLQNAFTVTAD